jgi:ferredoxin-nitrate reductase
MTATAPAATVKSTCCYCGVGCGILIHRSPQGQVRVEGDPDHPVNRGLLCSKGMNLHHTVMDQTDRLTVPQMRFHRAAPLQPVSWDTALERAAAVFRTLIAQHGPDSVGFYVSGQCLTEEYYLANKLVKGFLGTNNIDTNSRLCMSSAVVGYKMALGEDSVPCSYDDLELADCYFVAGANPAWCHPILFRRMEAHRQRHPEVKLIVVDPRRTQTAEMADLHLQINPGTDVVLYHAIGRALIERGDIDLPFIQQHTEGFEEYKEKVFARTIKQAAKICGITTEDLYWAVEYLARSRGFLTMWAMGLNQSAIGVNKNLALINLNLITGQIGKPGAGPFSLTGQPNAMGGREVGGLATMLAAHRELGNPEHRRQVAEFWGVPSVPEKPGLTATEMFAALREGRMKAVWIICTNPLVSLPDLQLAEEALRQAKFVVVQDVSNRSDTLAFADLVLPAATWAEKTGTMTNSERRVSYLHQAVPPPGQALPDSQILWRFAQKMGFGEAFNYQNESQVFDEWVRLTHGTRLDMTGLSHARLQAQGTLQWPVPTAQSVGTPRLFTDGQFYRPNGRAKIHAVPDENTSVPTSPEFPLILTTGRLRDQWHTMTKTGKVERLKQHAGQPFIEIHPKDAADRGLAEGQPVQVSSPQGQALVCARLNRNVKRGVVFMPMHWGNIMGQPFGRANNLTANVIDPISKEPDFKFTAVQVAAYVKPAERILVVGAGAAACRVVSAHRQWPNQDQVTVLGREQAGFYNRVRLPDYVSGTSPWEGLLKMSASEAAALDFTFEQGVEVTQIDRANKQVTDQQGRTYQYDKLVLCTGSRAAVPRNLTGYMQMPGMFTMRARPDADRLKAYLRPGDHVVVAGGGLLGLEMAASLAEMGMRVTIIQRTNRLMERQLDETASELLHTELTERGLEIFYDNEVSYILGQTEVEGVKLGSGHALACRAVLVAIGTTPNVELARAAGLAVNRGVVVDEYLRTSDPDIFALGEVAEFKGMLFGITAAAEQQAEVVCRYLNGDLARPYEGTLFMNILKMSGLQLCSLGTVMVPPGATGYEEIVFIDKAARYYKKCLVQNDRLVGAVLMGDKSEFATFRDLIAQRIELSDQRLKLLRSGQAAAPVLGKLVCSCQNVGEGNLAQAVAQGCDTVEKLGQVTGAGTGCGSCRPELKRLLAQRENAPALS